MGKPKRLSKKARKLANEKGIKVHGENPTNSEPKYSIDDILEKASDAMEMYNYEVAQHFCQRALEMDNDNVKALEVTSSLLLEVGDVENAKHCLGRAITVSPETGHSKYLSLAQLMDGKDSLDLYTKGIRLMEKEIQSVSESGAAAEDPSKELKRQLSSTYCAVAELYMTDLCDNDEAEETCNRSVLKAVEIDESNPEAWQAKARLHLVKNEFDEAKRDMNKSTDLWLPKYNSVLENKASSSEFDPVEVCPLLYTTRIATAKVLIELEEWDKATQVLDGLIEEDEDVVETWYLLGWLNKLRADFEASTANGSLDEDTKGTADGYKGNARFYLKKAAQVHSKTPTDDDQLMEHINELLEELGPGNDEEDENDENWEDYETTDEEENGMES